MTDKHWAVFALSDIKNALDEDRYDTATCHINDAIAAILARDANEPDPNKVAEGDKSSPLGQTF